jgi:hypothetical protein
MSQMKPGYSTPNLTRIEGCPDRNSVRPGMAHFAGTGPFGETCGSCAHLASTDRKKGRCAMFKKLAGHRGEEVDKNNAACKYFEARPQPPPIVAKRPALNSNELALLSQRRNRAKP